MKRILLALICLVPSLLFAQTNNEEVEIKAVINRFFEGMSKADSGMIRSTLDTSVSFRSVSTNREGKSNIRTESVDNYLKSIAGAQPGSLDEQIVFESIKIDGKLASVWTPYKFYVNKNFSHCGANSFTLSRHTGEWKIVFIIDTRRREGCDG